MLCAEGAESRWHGKKNQFPLVQLVPCERGSAGGELTW